MFFGVLIIKLYLIVVESINSILHVICERNKTLDQNMPSYPQIVSVKTINFDFCPPPAVSFALTLTEHNISVSAVRKLIVHGDRLITPSEFQGRYSYVLLLLFIKFSFLHFPRKKI